MTKVRKLADTLDAYRNSGTEPSAAANALNSAESKGSLIDMVLKAWDDKHGLNKRAAGILTSMGYSATPPGVNGNATNLIDILNNCSVARERACLGATDSRYIFTQTVGRKRG